MQDYDERDRVRAQAAQDASWKKFISDGRKHVVHQVSDGRKRVVHQAWAGRRTIYKQLTARPFGFNLACTC